MMERPNVGFVMYKDYIEYFGYLTKEEKADLLDAIFAYAFQGESPEGLSSVANLAFAVVRNQIDRDYEKYDRKCENNRKNGALGGRPKKEEKREEEPEKPTAKEDIPMTAETDKVVEISSNTRAQFEEFFDYYPKKTDKEEAAAEFEKIAPDEMEFFMIMDHLRYCMKSDAWKKEGGRYIPKAAVWLSRAEWKMT